MPDKTPEELEAKAARKARHEEREAKRKAEQAAALAKFKANVDAIRPRVQKRLCPTCREVGAYAGMVRGAHDLYSVSFRCAIDHYWSVTVGKLEAHALRPIDIDDQPPRPIARVALVPRPPIDEHEPLVPDDEPEIEEVEVDPGPLVPDPPPALIAEGTPPASLAPEPAGATFTMGTLTSGPICGVCGEPTGAKYYAGVPTKQGKMDLCLPCHTTGDWRASPRGR